MPHLSNCRNAKAFNGIERMQANGGYVSQPAARKNFLLYVSVACIFAVEHTKIPYILKDHGMR
jgi:hypothetical protein